MHSLIDLECGIDKNFPTRVRIRWNEKINATEVWRKLILEY